MSTTAISVMITICGIVWGGFALLMAKAVRREAAKVRRSESP